MICGSEVGVNDNMSPVMPYKSDYAIDIVFCVDLTAGANDLLQQFKDNCLAIIDGIYKKIEQLKGPVGIVRTRVIGFRDFVDDEAIVESPFFELPKQESEYLQMIGLLESRGGGDLPENALEAIALALKSQWTQEGCFRRHIICVITDAPALDFSERKDCPGYPYGMPKDMGELTAWYQQGIGTLDLRARRFVLFAPEHHSWDTISQTWDHCVHFKLEHNEDITDYTDQLERIICFNI